MNVQYVRVANQVNFVSLLVIPGDFKVPVFRPLSSIVFRSFRALLIRPDLYLLPDQAAVSHSPLIHEISWVLTNPMLDQTLRQYGSPGMNSGPQLSFGYILRVPGINVLLPLGGNTSGIGLTGVNKE